MTDHTNKYISQSLRYASLALAVVAFGGFGIYLLGQSHAENINSGSTSPILSLAPATMELKQGSVVNLAVNLAANADTSVGDVRVAVSYPAQLVRLDAVRGACQAPGYRQTAGTTSTSGQVTLACSRDAAKALASGQTTLATLVFTSLASDGDASIEVSDSSIVKNQTTGKAIRVQATKSNLTLQSRTANRPPTPRALPHYTNYRDLCPAKPGDGLAHCRAKQPLNADGSIVNNAAADGYGPAEWHNTYKLPCTPGGPVATVCAAPETYGPQTVAVIEAGNYASGVTAMENDLAMINQKYGIPPCTVANGCLSVVNKNGQTSPLPGHSFLWDDGETMLDIAAAHEVCQTCKIMVVIADNSNPGSMEAANDYAASQHVAAVSNSWGITDTQNRASLEHFFDHPGVPQLVANGDAGTYPAGQTDWPSSIPHVISVSGTTLKANSDGSRSSEVLWTGSGGGCSGQYAAPAWQKAITNWGSAGCGDKRAEGDIAAMSNPGIAIALHGQWTAYVGTSVAAPLVAAMFALANVHNTLIPASTQPSELLYKNASTANYTDIKSGSDCAGSVKTHCTAGTGFDVPSAFGAPNGLGAFDFSAIPTPPPTTPPPTTPPPTTPPPTTPPPTTPPPTVPPPPPKTGDINEDGKVNITDLSLLLKAWGTADTKADVNNSGKVDITDLSTLLGHWTG